MYLRASRECARSQLRKQAYVPGDHFLNRCRYGTSTTTVLTRRAFWLRASSALLPGNVWSNGGEIRHVFYPTADDTTSKSFIFAVDPSSLCFVDQCYFLFENVFSSLSHINSSKGEALLNKRTHISPLHCSRFYQQGILKAVQVNSCSLMICMGSVN